MLAHKLDLEVRSTESSIDKISLDATAQVNSLIKFTMLILKPFECCLSFLDETYGSLLSPVDLRDAKFQQRRNHTFWYPRIREN